MKVTDSYHPAVAASAREADMKAPGHGCLAVGEGDLMSAAWSGIVVPTHHLADIPI